MYFVYIIQSECGRFYIGSTDNLKKRLSQHNEGFSKWTSRYKNWKIFYSETFKTRTEVLIREKKIKSYKGGSAFKKLISPKI